MTDSAAVVLDGPTGRRRARRSLAAHPVMAAVFDELLATLSAVPGASVAVRGSVATEAVDAFSDLDLLLLLAADARPGDTHGWLRDAVAATGRLTAWFPATHIGMPDLLIFFVLRDAGIVKVDVSVVTAVTIDAGPPTLVVHDPNGDLRSALAAPPAATPRPDFDLLRNRFAGWIWYTYTKLARGELLEAADGLDATRRLAVLPYVHAIEGIPPYGYRFLERRVGRERVEQLLATYPRGIDREELLRCVTRLAALYVELETALGEIPPEDAPLHTIMDVIRRQETNGSSVQAARTVE